MEGCNNEIDFYELKKKDSIYLQELQIFFDKVECVKDLELRKEILKQMHRCEERIISICKELINK